METITRQGEPKRLLHAWYLLYFTYGLVAIAAGLDKFLYLLTDWTSYLYPGIPTALHMTTAQCIIAVGLIEIAAGVLLFLKPRLGGWVLLTWMLIVVINLLALGARQAPGCVVATPVYDIIVRDLVMAVGVYVFVLLTKELNK